MPAGIGDVQLAGGWFLLVGSLLPVVRGLLALVGFTVTLISFVVALVGVAFTIIGNSLPMVSFAVPLVGPTFPFVGDPFPLVAFEVTFVGLVVALVAETIAFVGATRTLVGLDEPEFLKPAASFGLHVPDVGLAPSFLAGLVALFGRRGAFTGGSMATGGGFTLPRREEPSAFRRSLAQPRGERTGLRGSLPKAQRDPLPSWDFDRFVLPTVVGCGHTSNVARPAVGLTLTSGGFGPLRTSNCFVCKGWPLDRRPARCLDSKIWARTCPPMAVLSTTKLFVSCGSGRPGCASSLPSFAIGRRRSSTGASRSGIPPTCGVIVPRHCGGGCGKIVPSRDANAKRPGHFAPRRRRSGSGSETHFLSNSGHGNSPRRSVSGWPTTAKQSPTNENVSPTAERPPLTSEKQHWINEKQPWTGATTTAPSRRIQASPTHDPERRRSSPPNRTMIITLCVRTATALPKVRLV